jgi:hypothetical protein
MGVEGAPLQEEFPIIMPLHVGNSCALNYLKAAKTKIKQLDALANSLIALQST